MAAKIMYPDASKDVIAEKSKEFDAKTDVYAAAARGYVDSIIQPASVRKQLLYAFEMLYTKSI